MWIGAFVTGIRPSRETIDGYQERDSANRLARPAVHPLLRYVPADCTMVCDAATISKTLSHRCPIRL